MKRPVVGIIGNFYLIDDNYPVQSTGTMNIDAISECSGAIPLMFPATPNHASVDDLLDVFDGFLFTGARPNVHPKHYGKEYTDAHGQMDEDRDALALPLIRSAVAAGKPVLGICRGFQELAVAFGATLHPEIRDLPDIDNHRMPPEGTLDEKFALRHDVTFAEGSQAHSIFGAVTVRTNSLHGQGIDVAGDRISVDGTAPDGTIEAISIKDAKGFAFGVQWHPEYNASNDPVSRALFGAFGQALAKKCPS